MSCAFVSKATCLGIHIDNKLSWSPHVKSLRKRFSARVKKLKQLKGLDNRILESIYFKGIIPSITCSIALWGTSKSLQTLEDIHIRAARFIFNIKESTLSTEVLAAKNGSHYRTFTNRGLQPYLIRHFTTELRLG